MFGQGAKGKQPDRHTERDLENVCKGRDGKEWGAVSRRALCVVGYVFSSVSLFLFSLYFK